MHRVKSGEQKVLLYDPERCTGCRYCEIACTYWHFNEISLKKAHLHIIFEEETNEFEAIYCQHCEEPVCVAVCPADAAIKDEETGLVKINPIRCIGCQTCNVACPLSVPWFNEANRVSMKCDFCDGDPQCVKVCSPKALRIVSREEALEINKIRYVEVLAK